MLNSYIYLIFFHLLLIIILLLGVNHDKEYKIKTTIKDIPYFVICEIINVGLLCFYNNIYVNIFLSIGLAILTISVYTDKKTMYVYIFPAYILFFLGIILESIFIGKFSCQIAFVFLLPIFLGIFNAFGKGDIPMCMILGGSIYLSSFNVIESLLAECIMLLLTEIFFIIKAIIEKNLKNPFRLKEKKPLGPSILSATYIVLILNVIFCKNMIHI